MIDLSKEQPLRIPELAKLAGRGRGGRPINFSTIWRWILKGCRAHDGTLVQLEAIKVGGHLCSSVEAFQRFCERLTPDFKAVIEEPRVRTPGQRRRSSERASRNLDDLRI
jgi:hypothetical protein